MSLLMDALKKAELARRQGHVNAPDETATAAVPQDELFLEPLPEATLIAGIPAPSANQPHPDSHLEELEAQFLAEATRAAITRQTMQTAPAPVMTPTATKLAETPPSIAEKPLRAAAPPSMGATHEQPAQPARASAQNFFTAKKADTWRPRKGFSIAVGIFATLSVFSIGGYFWWQLQPKPALSASRIAPSGAVAPIAPGVGAAPAPATMAAPIVAQVPTTPMIHDDNVDDSAPSPVAAHLRRPPASAAAPPPPLPNGDDRAVRITKAPLQVDPALTRGFDALNRGELALAQLEYQRARTVDPRNTDVLHGLAAIAVRQGRHDQADVIYRQITEADPQDAVAVAALINSHGQIDPNVAESRLKVLASAQPELAAPHFSLGNLYARYGRWSEAQQAYFRAYNAEPDNPDILYNLAISLEHLRQNKLAAQFYSQAITAAQDRHAGFDTTQAAARLHTLLP